jgi:hypothetical protein
MYVSNRQDIKLSFRAFIVTIILFPDQGVEGSLFYFTVFPVMAKGFGYPENLGEL